MKNLTVIIPVYNEETAIEKTLMELTIYSEKNNWEVLVVNDGSTDNTKNILNSIYSIKVIYHPYNKGYGAALKAGIKNATTDLICFYDADGQHNPNDVEQLILNLDNYDMLVGERQKDSHKEWVRRPGKWLLSKVANFLTGRKIPDLNSGLRLVKRNVILKLLHLFPDGFSFSTTSTIAFLNLGLNVGYYPIKTNKRIGKSSVRQLKHGSNVLLLILRLIILFNPLKVFVPISFLIFMLGIIYEVMQGIVMIESGHERLIPGAFFLMITGILIFFFGLVVDQVSEMRKHQFYE
ncbi:MAG: glycosyltransferase family 2 protein [Ignavibacteriales bacterium]|nr:glycosyltransferase family 2 protein [Ignavibacteriales bacterium]